MQGAAVYTTGWPDSSWREGQKVTFSQNPKEELGELWG